MSSIDEIREARIKKLALLRERAVDPYPAQSKREISLKDAVDNFSDLESEVDLILLDRYFYTSAVYQIGSGLTPKEILQINHTSNVFSCLSL